MVQFVAIWSAVTRADALWGPQPSDASLKPNDFGGMRYELTGCAANSAGSGCRRDECRLLLPVKLNKKWQWEHTWFAFSMLGVAVVPTMIGTVNGASALVHVLLGLGRYFGGDGAVWCGLGHFPLFFLAWR